MFRMGRDGSAHATVRLIPLRNRKGCIQSLALVTDGTDVRDAHGRLYAAFDVALVRDELAAAATLLLDEEVVSASSGKKIHWLVVRK